MLCSAEPPRGCVKPPHQSRLHARPLTMPHKQPDVNAAGRLHKCLPAPRKRGGQNLSLVQLGDQSLGQMVCVLPCSVMHAQWSHCRSSASSVSWSRSHCAALLPCSAFSSAASALIHLYNACHAMLITNSGTLTVWPKIAIDQQNCLFDCHLDLAYRVSIC